MAKKRILSVCMDSADDREIRALAQKYGMDLSDFMRRLIQYGLKEVRKDPPGVLLNTATGCESA